MPQRKLSIVWLAALALLATPLIGCGGGSYETAEKSAPVIKVVPEEVSETLVAAKLAGADALDGEEDFIVSKCPGCALAMDGKAEHALEVEGYELHFCSDSCRDNFEKDTMAKVSKLEVEVPEG